jgi:hypothetical protein
VLAGLIFGPLIPESALHDCRGVDCLVREDHLITMLAEGTDQVMGRLDLYAAGEYAVVVVPDTREVNGCPSGMSGRMNW